MEIKIEVSGSADSMTQANSQRIKRVASVLTEAGFKVEILWGVKKEELAFVL